MNHLSQRQVPSHTSTYPLCTTRSDTLPVSQLSTPESMARLHSHHFSLPLALSSLPDPGKPPPLRTIPSARLLSCLFVSLPCLTLTPASRAGLGDWVIRLRPRSFLTHLSDIRTYLLGTHLPLLIWPGLSNGMARHKAPVPSYSVLVVAHSIQTPRTLTSLGLTLSTRPMIYPYYLGSCLAIATSARQLSRPTPLLFTHSGIRPQNFLLPT